MSRLLIRAITALFVVWPPIHMVITEVYGISPWRLGGYGMYSVPHPERFRIVRALVRVAADDSTCPESVAAEIGALPRQGAEIYLLHPSGKLARLERSRGLDVDPRPLRDFPLTTLAPPFAGAVRRALADCGITAEPGIIVTVDEQRLDMNSLTLYAESRALVTE